MHQKSLGDYEAIIRGLCTDDVGLDLKKIGVKASEKVWQLNDSDLANLNQIEILQEINPVVSGLIEDFKKDYRRPIWTKINVLDQAWNQYVGIGHLDFGDGWLDFILKYLDYDRADQGGDTLFVILHPDLDWALYFELSTEKDELKIEKYKR